MTRSNAVWWVLAALLVLFFWRFGQLASYLLGAIALSFAGRPVVRWIATRRVGSKTLGHGLGAATTLALMVSLLTGVVLLFTPLLTQQVAALSQVNSEELIAAWNDLLKMVDRYTTWVDLSGTGMANSAYLADQLTHMVPVDALSGLLTGLLSSLGNVFVAGFSVLFMAFFLMREPDLFHRLVLGLTPPSRQASAERIMSRSGELLTRYFGGLVIQVSIVTTVVGLGLTVMGVPHGLLLGLLAGLFNLIPYLGPIAGALVGVVVMVSSGVDGGTLGWGLAMFAAAQAIDNVFTQPVVFAKRVFAHPLEIFIVVSVAGSLAGPMGMVLAIPGYTLIRIVAREFLEEVPWIQALTQRMESPGQGDVNAG